MPFDKVFDFVIKKKIIGTSDSLYSFNLQNDSFFEKLYRERNAAMIILYFLVCLLTNAPPSKRQLKMKANVTYSNRRLVKE